MHQHPSKFSVIFEANASIFGEVTAEVADDSFSRELVEKQAEAEVEVGILMSTRHTRLPIKANQHAIHEPVFLTGLRTKENFYR